MNFPIHLQLQAQEVIIAVAERGNVDSEFSWKIIE
jgi:hypothetical protein